MMLTKDQGLLLRGGSGDLLFTGSCNRPDGASAQMMLLMLLRSNRSRIAKRVANHQQQQQ